MVRTSAGRISAVLLCAFAFTFAACGPSGGDTASAPSQAPDLTAQSTALTAIETSRAEPEPTAFVTAMPLQPTVTVQPPTETPVPATATALLPTATLPPKPTAARRPLLTPTVASPTETPQPAVDFKVIEQRMLSLRENQGSSVNGSVRVCGLLHIYFIKVVDKNGIPLANILVRRVYAGSVEIPPTGSKGPGMTEEVPPRYAGDMLFVLGDTSGARFTSEQTRVLSLNDRDIPNADLITGGYCRDDTECNYRKTINLLCLGHYSYSIVFQRQW
jgi:hypothetical protein